MTLKTTFSKLSKYNSYVFHEVNKQGNEEVDNHNFDKIPEKLLAAVARSFSIVEECCLNQLLQMITSLGAEG